MIDYDRIAADYGESRTTHFGVIEKLSSAAVDKPGFAVLDIGCGAGGYTAALSRNSRASFFCVDPSEGMIEEARKNAPDASFKLGSAEKLPFMDGFFDLAFSVDVIHHVKDRLDYFLEAARVLKRGGRLCTVTDSEAVIKSRTLARYFPETVPLELRRYPPISTIRVNMRSAGFVDAREETVEEKVFITDLSAYRKRLFSALRLIGHEAHARGMERMETDLASGPIETTVRYVMAWGRKG